MKVKVYRLRTRYWIPRRQEDAYRYILTVLIRGIKKTKGPSLILISEKPLRVILGQIYPEDKIRCSKLSRFVALVLHHYVWCRLLRHILPRRMITLCEVDLEDICRHKHYASTQCRANILSLLKPFSECGVDVSLLPYTYALRVRDDIRSIIHRLYRDLLRATQRKLVGVAVIDSDFSLALRSLKSLILTSRSTHVGCSLNLGFITYLLGRTRALRRLFIKTPTIVYYTGIRLNTSFILMLVQRAHKYLQSTYGINIVDNMLILEADSYKSITWRDLSRTIHSPLLILELVK